MPVNSKKVVFMIALRCNCIAAAPKLKALWESYHDTYDVSTIVVPALPITSRPISDVEPYLTHNGKKVQIGAYFLAGSFKAFSISSMPHCLI